MNKTYEKIVKEDFASLEVRALAGMMKELHGKSPSAADAIKMNADVFTSREHMLAVFFMQVLAAAKLKLPAPHEVDISSLAQSLLEASIQVELRNLDCVQADLNPESSSVTVRNLERRLRVHLAVEGDELNLRLRRFDMLLKAGFMYIGAVTSRIFAIADDTEQLRIAVQLFGDESTFVQQSMFAIAAREGFVRPNVSFTQVDTLRVRDILQTELARICE